jgi:hypothetical protein
MADHAPTDLPPLTPLPYHDAVVRFLREEEPEVWRWASSAQAREEHADAVRQELLKQTYRLDASAYPDLHRCLEVAVARLGLTVPVTLYQAGDGTMNASLYFVPGEAHIVFAGPVLERMKGPELEAVLGHELSHHLLWERDGGIYHAADRILSAASDDNRCSASHAQTARLYRLYTECFADRGGAVACGSLEPAVTALVKSQTGLAEVSAASYLKQADEICGRGVLTQEHSHPEVFVRARALRLWSERDAQADSWLAAALEGPLAIDMLDLTGQQRLEALTRRVLSQLLRPAFLRSEAMLAHARRFFPDFEPASAEDAELAAEIAAATGTHDYLAALMMDIAAADRDLEGVPLAAALDLAGRWGVTEPFEKMAQRELKLPKRKFDKIKQEAASLLEHASGQHV